MRILASQKGRGKLLLRPLTLLSILGFVLLLVDPLAHLPKASADEMTPRQLAVSPGYAEAPEITCYNCHGLARWPGATFGAATDIYVQTLSCPNCNGEFLSEEMWLADLNTNSWTEVGYYTGYPAATNSLSYFYAYMLPSQHYTEVALNLVPSADLGQYTLFKVTRNRQTTSTLLVGVASATTNINRVINTTQGGGDWAGNAMDIGSELYTDGITPSSNGAVAWTENKWQMSNGLYYYQSTDVNPIAEPYQHPYWEIWPSGSSTGGKFRDSCCTP